MQIEDRCVLRSEIKGNAKLFAWTEDSIDYLPLVLQYAVLFWEISVKSWISFALYGDFCVFLNLL